MGKYFEVTAALGKYFEDTAALGKYFEALPFSNFQKQMVSGSKLKCPSKVSWEVSFSLYYTVIYGNCLGNVVIGMEKCGKMCENGEKMWKNVKNVLETRFYYTTEILCTKFAKNAKNSVSSAFCATFLKNCEKTVFYHVFRDTLYKVRKKCEKQRFFFSF